MLNDHFQNIDKTFGQNLSGIMSNVKESNKY